MCRPRQIEHAPRNKGRWLSCQSSCTAQSPCTCCSSRRRSPLPPHRKLPAQTKMPSGSAACPAHGVTWSHPRRSHAAGGWDAGFEATHSAPESWLCFRTEGMEQTAAWARRIGITSRETGERRNDPTERDHTAKGSLRVAALSQWMLAPCRQMRRSCRWGCSGTSVSACCSRRRIRRRSPLQAPAWAQVSGGVVMRVVAPITSGCVDRLPKREAWTGAVGCHARRSAHLWAC